MVYATKEKYNAYMKVYYQKKLKEKVQCECGAIVNKLTIKSHNNSKKHKESIDFINNIIKKT